MPSTYVQRGLVYSMESTPPEQKSEFCSLSRNESERTGDPETFYLGRAPVDRAKAAGTSKLTDAVGHSGGAVATAR